MNIFKTKKDDFKNIEREFEKEVPYGRMFHFTSILPLIGELISCILIILSILSLIFFDEFFKSATNYINIFILIAIFFCCLIISFGFFTITRMNYLKMLKEYAESKNKK